MVIICLSSSIRSAGAQEYIILRITLNEEDKGEFFCILSPDRDIWLKREDLTEIGLNSTVGTDSVFDQETYVPLSSIPDLDFYFKEDEVLLIITAAPHMFMTQVIDARYSRSANVQYTDTGSVFFNYGGTYIDETDGSLFDITGELGISFDRYFGKSTFVYDKTDDKENTSRLETSLTVDDRKNLRTVTIGDHSAFSGVLGSGTLLGGINLSKNFSIDPYFITYPSLDLKGAVETPSEVEVYLDGMLVKREHLSPGEFVFRDVPSTAGLGTARVVIHDIYGRERTVATPFYFSDRLLKKGLHEYSYSAGFIREHFGRRSFSYGKAAFLAFHKLGYADTLTIGYTAEASDNIVNVGPTASFTLAKAGQVDIAAAVSRADGEYGYSGLASYAFQSRNINARISVRSNSEEYANLAIGPSDDKAKAQLNAALGFGLKKAGSLTAAYSLSDMYIAETTSRISLSFNKALTKTATLYIHGSEIKGSGRTHEIVAGIHMYFGRDISGNMSYIGREDDDIEKVTVRKSVPSGTGHGFRADFEHSRDRNNWGVNYQYQNNAGMYEAGYSDRMDNRSTRISAAGGIGYIDKSIFFSRPILDSYAKVKIGELEGVRTYYYGNEIGKTDSRGEVIIPNLHSFYDNKIDVEVKDIPLNYAVPALTQYISPPFRSGSVIHFDVRRIQALVGSLWFLEGGLRTPIRSAIIYIETDTEVIEGAAGTDGEFYVENVPPGTHSAQALFNGSVCHFTINVPKSENMILETGDITCEVRK
jgi:outer membrane usher protein